MTSSLPPDPYQPPALLAAEAPASHRRRPGWFITICVIAIALGGMGFFHAIYAITELTLGDPLSMIMGPPSEDEFEAPTKVFEDGIRAVQLRHRPALMTLAIARLALAIGLVSAGVWCLGGNAAGRTLLIGVFAAAILFEIADSLIQIRVSGDLFDPFRGLGQSLDEQQSGPGNAQSNLAELVFVAFLWGLICLYYACQAAKVIYYVGGLIYLRRSALDRLFAAQGELS